jgi:hypothetical protein
MRPYDRFNTMQALLLEILLILSLSLSLSRFNTMQALLLEILLIFPQVRLIP